MGASNRISVVAVARASLEAIRRRWWLILPLLAGLWWVDLNAITTLVSPLVMVMGVDYFQPGSDVIEDLCSGLVAAMICGLALSAARKAPIRPGALLMGLVVALPTILLAEVATDGPGWLRNIFLKMDGDPGLTILILASGAMIVWLVYLLVLFVTVGAAVPMAIDRRLSPLGALRGAWGLTVGRRRSLAWIGLLLGLLDIALIVLLTAPFMLAGQDDHWSSNLGTYVVTGLDAVVMAALYLQLAEGDDAHTRTAETFA
jgi:hypothetical protein